MGEQRGRREPALEWEHQMTRETTGRIYFLPLGEAMAELEEMLHEVESGYGEASHERRKKLARRMLAIGMARQAISIAMLDEKRRAAR